MSRAASSNAGLILGRPAIRGLLRESFSLVIDPGLFESGASYYLEALANDFRPGGAPSRSRPILLRVKSGDDLALRDDDPLKPAFDALKRAIASQEKANRLTANLRTYLEDVLQKGALASQVDAVNSPQNEARNLGSEAASLFSEQTDGKPYAETLSTLVNHDMAAAQDDLRSLNSAPQGGLPDLLAGLGTRQAQILTGCSVCWARLPTREPPRSTPSPTAKIPISPRPPARRGRANGWMK